MAQAFRCDRCGEYYDPYDRYKLRDLINISSDEDTVRYPTIRVESALSQSFTRDLCPDCLVDLAQWWNKGRDAYAED